MPRECSFAGASSKASWFHYPLGPNNVTYASFNFLILLQFHFLRHFFHTKWHSAIYDILSFRVLRYSAIPPFFGSVILLYNSRYRILQLARFANLAALFGIIIIIIIVIITILIIMIMILNKIIWYYQLS